MFTGLSFHEISCLSAVNSVLDWRFATFSFQPSNLVRSQTELAVLILLCNTTRKEGISIFLVLFSANSFYLSLYVFSSKINEYYPFKEGIHHKWVSQLNNLTFHLAWLWNNESDECTNLSNSHVGEKDLWHEMLLARKQKEKEFSRRCRNGPYNVRMGQFWQREEKCTSRPRKLDQKQWQDKM